MEPDGFYGFNSDDLFSHSPSHDPESLESVGDFEASSASSSSSNQADDGDPADADSLQFSMDQGEGIRGEYIRMPNGKILDDEILSSDNMTLHVGDPCICGNGEIVKRKRYMMRGNQFEFFGCSNFPQCRLTESIAGKKIPKHFSRAPVHTPIGTDFFLNTILI